MHMREKRKILAPTNNQTPGIQPKANEIIKLLFPHLVLKVSFAFRIFKISIFSQTLKHTIL
jgi:hypothetical protein